MQKRARAPVNEQAPWPWQLPLIGNAEIFALQALERGEANPAQQKLALGALFKLAAIDRMSFYPGAEDGRRASDFAEGKRWVGSQIRRLLKLRPEHNGRPMSEPKEPAADAKPEVSNG